MNKRFKATAAAAVNNIKMAPDARVDKCVILFSSQ
jgi:hypothetical protein